MIFELRSERSSARGGQTRFPASEIPVSYLLAGVFLTSLSIAILMRAAELDLGPTDIFSAVVGALTAILLRIYLYHKEGRSHQIAGDFIEYVGLFTFVCLAGVIASYPVAHFSAGVRDAWLQKADQYLGFNWIGWYDFVSAHSSLKILGRLAYDSIFVSPVVLFAYFAYQGHRAHAHQFIATFWLAAVITLLLFPFMPAQGPLAFLWRGPIPYMPESGLYQALLIPAVKGHILHRISLSDLRGLVSAPSFHTASAFLYTAAAWPFRRLRWPVLLVNGMMLLAIPVEGTHYLVDMIGGMVVAAVALLATPALLACLHSPVPVPGRARFNATSDQKQRALEQ